MSQGFTSSPLSTIANVTNLQAELDSKLSLSAASLTSLTSATAYVGVVSATTISATTFYGNATNLTGVATEFTGVTTIDFGCPVSGETGFTTIVVLNSNVTNNSYMMFSFSASTNHLDSEEPSIEGIILKESDINPGVGFTLNAYSGGDSWGVYNIKYKIIN